MLYFGCVCAVWEASSLGTAGTTAPSSPHPPVPAASLPSAEKLLLTADLLVVRSGRWATDKGTEAQDGKLTASHDFKGSFIKARLQTHVNVSQQKRDIFPSLVLLFKKAPIVWFKLIHFLRKLRTYSIIKLFLNLLFVLTFLFAYFFKLMVIAVPAICRHIVTKNKGRRMDHEVG